MYCKSIIYAEVLTAKILITVQILSSNFEQVKHIFVRCYLFKILDKRVSFLIAWRNPGNVQNISSIEMEVFNKVKYQLLLKITTYRICSKVYMMYRMWKMWEMKIVSELTIKSSSKTAQNMKASKDFNEIPALRNKFIRKSNNTFQRKQLKIIYEINSHIQ